MPLFRKKPIVVTAEQWFPDRHVDGVRRVPANRVDLTKTRGIMVDRPERWVCDTLEGQLEVQVGDWIVTGVRGERYPCKPDIFELTYEGPLYAFTPVGLKALFTRRRK